MITDSRSTRVRFTTTKRESENEIHHRTFRSLLISISPPASKRALLYFTSPYFRRFEFEWWRRTGETSPSPEKSRERNTSLWPCFRHGDRARTENPGNHPHRPSPNRPRSNTDTSLSLCVCNSTAKLCKHIGTRTIFEKIFSKSLGNPSSSPVFFFFFFPSLIDDGRQRNQIYRTIVYDYWMLGLSGRAFFGEKGLEMRSQK